MSDPTLLQEHSFVTNGGLGGGTGLTVTMSSTAAGNLLVAFVSWGSQFTTFGVSDAYTFPAGWTRVDHTPTGSAHYEEMWYYWNNPGGITTINVTGPKPGGTNNAVEFLWVGEYNNIKSSSDPLEHHASTTGSSGSPSLSTSVADAAVGDLVIACFGWNKTGSNTTFTHGTGYTDVSITQSNNIIQDQLFGEYKVSTAATTQTADGTIGVSEAWGGIIATFVKNTTSVTQTAVIPLESDIAVTQSKVEPLEARGGVSQSKAEPLEAQQREVQTAAGALEAQLRLSESNAIPIEEDSIQVAQTGILSIEAYGPIVQTAETNEESFYGAAGASDLPLEARTGMNVLALPIASQRRVVRTASLSVESWRTMSPPAHQLVNLEARAERSGVAVERLEARGPVVQTAALCIEASGHQVVQTAVLRTEAGTAAQKTAQARLEARGFVVRAAGANLESWNGIGGPQTAQLNIETIVGLHFAFIQIESRAPAATQTAAIPIEMRGLEFNVHQSRAVPIEIEGRRVHSLSPFPRTRFESTQPLLQPALANVESQAHAGLARQAVIPIAAFEDPSITAVLNVEIRPHDITPVQLQLSLETRQGVEGRLYLPIELRVTLPATARLALEARGFLQAQQVLRVESKRAVQQTAAVPLEQARTHVSRQAAVKLEARGFVTPEVITLNLELRPFQGTLPPGAEGILIVTRRAAGTLIVHEALPLSES